MYAGPESMTSSLHMWKVAKQEVLKLERLKREMQDGVTSKVDQIVKMVEHPAFGELMARDPVTGHAYQNLVLKCKKKVKVMQHAHLKDSLSEEVQLIKSLNPTVARNTDCQHSKYLLLLN